MDTKRILSELRAERTRIDQAISAFEALDGTAAAPAVRANKPGPKPGKPGPKARGRKRGMSAEGRRRISEMMKKRWAERKKKAKA
jgi:hypothetical protein